MTDRMQIAVAAAAATSPDESESEWQRAALDALAALSDDSADRVRLSVYTTDDHERVVSAVRAALGQATDGT